VPVKTRPSDWDHLFAPNAPRRGGPLRALVNVLITIVLIALLSAGGVYAVNYRNKQIADKLSIAETTVNFHIKNLVDKLGANDRTHAVTIAVRRGLLQV